MRETLSTWLWLQNECIKISKKSFWNYVRKFRVNASNVILVFFFLPYVYFHRWRRLAIYETAMHTDERNECLLLNNVTKPTDIVHDLSQHLFYISYVYERTTRRASEWSFNFNRKVWEWQDFSRNAYMMIIPHE